MHSMRKMVVMGEFQRGDDMMSLHISKLDLRVPEM